MRALDVAVVGAGPAGAWAAYLLARRGARVAIVDGSHPREKPCGGGVTGRALDLVADALDARALPRRAIRRARFVDSIRRRSIAVPLDDGALVVASRTELDGALLRAAIAAGAAHVAARARDIVRGPSGFRVETSAGALTAPLLIGADGANSLVRRRLARPFARHELSIATGCFADGVVSDEIVVEFVSEPPGYIWSFPRPSHLAIGICAQADAGRSAASLHDRVMRWTDDVHVADGAARTPYSWPIPSLPSAAFGALTTGGRGWLLAGDAAGLVDPITREGIYFALASGAWAADALASPAAEAEAQYRERVHDEIASELARAARYKAAFFRPQFTRLLIDALERAPIRAVLADLIAGRQRYAGLKWRLARTLDVGLAWRFSQEIVRGK